MRRQGLIAGKGVYVGVMLVVGIAILDAARQQTVAPPQEQVTPPTRHATLEGTWNLNVAASSATGDLGPTPRSQPTGGFGGGRRGGGGRGGGGTRGGTQNQNQNVRALIGDLTNAPQTLTIALSSTAVTMTSGTGRSDTYMTDGKQETHSLVNGSIKTTTKQDGAIVTQHIDAGNNLKYLRMYYVSGDQLIVTITPDSGSSGSGNQQVRPGQAAEQRSVYDPAK
jgi:hypothetical protein